MRIALDATYSVGRALSGVGVYSREILNGVSALHPEAEFRFCYRPHRFLRSFSESLRPNCSRTLLVDTFGTPAASVFHGLNQRLPRRRKEPCVTTFHDLFVLTSEYSTPEFRKRFAEQARDAADGSDLIIAVSEFTATQVCELLKVDRRKIRVIYHGVRPPKVSVSRQISGNMILHVGAVQTRKNIIRLVEAFEQLSGEPQLVLAGSPGFGASLIDQRIEQSPARNRIQRAGYVSDEELESLYARAAVLAFPSLDEGFGMPVLEGMKRRIPVLASNRSAVAEVAGDAALLVDPLDTNSIAGGLDALLASQTLREEFVKRGLGRVSQFSWEQTCSQVWDVYREVTA